MIPVPDIERLTAKPGGLSTGLRYDRPRGCQRKPLIVLVALASGFGMLFRGTAALPALAATALAAATVSTLTAATSIL
jgi:hypothetical protein